MCYYLYFVFVIDKMYLYLYTKFTKYLYLILLEKCLFIFDPNPGSNTSIYERGLKVLGKPVCLNTIY